MIHGPVSIHKSEVLSLASVVHERSVRDYHNVILVVGGRSGDEMHDICVRHHREAWE